MRQLLTIPVLLLLAPNANAFQLRTPLLASPSPAAPSLAMASGPKAEGRQRRPRTTRSGSKPSSSGPQAPARPRQRERPKTPGVFDAKGLTALQSPNEECPPLDLKALLSSDNGMRCMTPDIQFGNKVEHPFTFLSLDDLFDDKKLRFSAKFNADAQFRQDLRMAIRQDIFDTTPFYANLSEKAASVLLLPDSSLEGSWRKNPEVFPEGGDLRMKHTTKVLQEALADDNITGDDLFQAIGKLCGPKPSTHWIDIFGVQDRHVSHSWHLDFGKSPENSRTVLWGFPPEDNYQGCGVFSHVIPLQQECIAPDDHPRMEPVLFEDGGTIDEEYIVRPQYEPGKELIMYRDIDVLHSAPDVIYRTSVMRFM